MRILVINGPNLNMLGIREPDLYGRTTYTQLEEYIRSEAFKLGLGTEIMQSNHEGVIIDKIQEAYKKIDGIVINPGGYTFTSIAILDALKAVSIPTVEVHVSDLKLREEFRHHSYIAPVCIATVMGEGIPGYQHALRLLKEYQTGVH